MPCRPCAPRAARCGAGHAAASPAKASWGLQRRSSCRRRLILKEPGGSRNAMVATGPRRRQPPTPGNVRGAAGQRGACARDASGPLPPRPARGHTGGAGGALLVNRLKGAVRTRGDSRKLTHTDRRWPGTPTSPERRAPPEATGGPRALPRRSHGALDTQHGSCRPHARRVLAGAAAVRRGSTRRSAPPGRQRRRAGPSPPLSQAAGVGPGPPPHGTAPAAGTQTRVPGEAGESRLTESSWNDEN